MNDDPANERMNEELSKESSMESSVAGEQGGENSMGEQSAPAPMLADKEPSQSYRLNAERAQKISRGLMIMGGVFLAVALAGLVGDMLSGGAGHASIGSNGETIRQAASGSGEVDSQSRFFHSYLFSYAFYMSLFIGCLFFVVLQHLTRSEWSVTVRRIPEAVIKVFPLLIVLAIPILVLGMGSLYHWTHSDEVAEDAILQAKSSYLNLGFFYVRTVLYFVIFYAISRWYYRHSVGQDKGGDLIHTMRMQQASPLATLFFAITVTFFAFDYLMSLDPHWYSTIWGIYYFAGAVVVSLSFMVIVFLVLRMRGHLAKEVNVEHYHDLGKLIFAFNVFWSYIAFSQYLLIWYANIPEGTIFFLNRINYSWLSVSVLLIVGHTIFPILAFISRNAKRNLKMQLFMASWLIFMQMVDLYWVILPNVDRLGIHVTYVDFLIFLGMGGLFMGLFTRALAANAIIPIKDPRLQRALDFENA